VTNAPNAIRSIFAYVVLVPMALVLGYLLATSNVGPNVDLSSLAPIILVFGLICVPLLLKWHQPILLLTLNMTTVLFFLPGSPPLWFATAGISSVLAFGHRALDRETRFVTAPSVVWPLVFLLAVVVGTGYLTGGFGVRVLGSGQYGGKRYLYIFAALAAFFAIIARPIPHEKAMLYVGLFFLGNLANLMSNIIPQLGPDFYWLALIFPVSLNDMGSLAAQSVSGSGIARFLGLTAASFGVFCFLLAKYGIREALSARHSWRFFAMLVVLVVGLVGGFRLSVVVLSLTFLLVFLLEGLLRTKYTLFFVGLLILALTLLVPFGDKLPLSIQRSLTVLPLDLNLNPIARYEAEASSEWRLRMWAIVVPEVPKYLFMPKGFGMNGEELDLTGELVARGQAQTEELAILAGDYHNGPLSLLIPFGIWGFTVWSWFLFAAVRALWLNYRHGAAELKKINTLLLAYFLTQMFMFFFIFGAFFNDVVTFLSLVGLSLSLNNGICKPAPRQVEDEVGSRLLETPSVSFRTA
jgi:hypothetical protein